MGYPHFRRWVKVTVIDEPMFSDTIEATRILYNFMAISAEDVLPQPEFFVGAARSFRPSASMLTSLETVPQATTVDIPPLYNHWALEAALQAGNGKYMFSPDNEVLFFMDQTSMDGYVAVCLWTMPCADSPIGRFCDGRFVQAVFMWDKSLSSGSSSGC